jgi:hypothetical protein
MSYSVGSRASANETFRSYDPNFRRPSTAGSFDSSIRSTASVNAEFRNLNDAIFQEDWENVLQIIEVHPKCASKRYISPSFMKEGRTAQVLPIHQACSMSSVPIKVLEALIYAFPESLQKTESGVHRNCLQIACRGRVSEDVLLYLLTQDASGAAHQDAMGRVALHYACSSQFSLKTIDALIQACPASVRAVDSIGKWTPLHIAASKCHSEQVVRLLLSTSTEPVVMSTSKGSTPLDLALMNNGPSPYKEAIVTMLMQEEEKYRKTPTFQNMEIAEQNRFKRISNSSFLV